MMKSKALHELILEIMNAARLVKSDPDRADGYLQTIQMYLLDIHTLEWVIANKACAASCDFGSNEDVLFLDFDWATLLDNAGIQFVGNENTDVVEFLRNISTCKTSEMLVGCCNFFPEKISYFLDAWVAYRKLQGFVDPKSEHSGKIGSVAQLTCTIMKNSGFGAFYIQSLDPQDPTRPSFLARLKAIEIANKLLIVNEMRALVGEEGSADDFKVARDHILESIQVLNCLIGNNNEGKIDYGLRIFAKLAAEIAKNNNQDDLMTDALEILHGGYKIAGHRVSFDAHLPGSKPKYLVSFDLSNNLAAARKLLGDMQLKFNVCSKGMVNPTFSLAEVFAGSTTGDDGEARYTVYVVLNEGLSSNCARNLESEAKEIYKCFMGRHPQI